MGRIFDAVYHIGKKIYKGAKWVYKNREKIGNTIRNVVGKVIPSVKPPEPPKDTRTTRQKWVEMNDQSFRDAKTPAEVESCRKQREIIDRNWPT
jgi:hypothetical protein